MNQGNNMMNMNQGNNMMNQGNNIMNQGNNMMNQGNMQMNMGMGNGGMMDMGVNQGNMNMGMNQVMFDNGMQDMGNQRFNNGMNNMEMGNMNNDMSDGRSSGMFKGLARDQGYSRGNRSVSPRRARGFSARGGRGSNRGSVKDRLGFKSNISVDPSQLENVAVNEEE